MFHTNSSTPREQNQNLIWLVKTVACCRSFSYVVYVPHKLSGHLMLSQVSCTVLGILLHQALHVAFLFISRHNAPSGRFIHRVNQSVNKVLLLKLKYVLWANIQMIKHRQWSRGYVSVLSTISLMHASHISSVET